MKRYLAGAAVATILFSVPALAVERTVTLAVEGMFCPACPYIVKRALAAVPGVRTVEVSFRENRAVVTFDDEKTGVAALTVATANVGFPSRQRE